MPIHLDSVTDPKQRPGLIAWILKKGMDECDSVLASDDHLYFHIHKGIVDHKTNETIGRLVYTIKNDDEHQQLQLLDLDIVLENAAPSKLRFLKLMDGSSNANEYYEVETVDDEQHLVIETVNRHSIPDGLLNTERSVSISIFPFQLSIYENIDKFNQWAGFGKPITVGNTDLKVGGFSERFAMPGAMFSKSNEDDGGYSFMIGTVKSFRDVRTEFGEFKLDFVLARVDTAVGVVPVAMGRDVFDLAELHQDSIVAMNAYVKADLALPNIIREFD